MQHIQSLVGSSLIAMAVVTSPFSAPQTSSIHNGLIAYESVQHIRIFNPLTGYDTLFEKNSNTPRWSPNGKKLAFINHSDHLQVTIQDRSLPLYHPTYNYADSMPAWSGDGSQVAFVRTKESPKSALFVLNSHTGAVKNLSGWSTNSLKSPTWSPDGKRLAFEKQTGSQRDIIIKDLVTHQEHTVTTLSDNINSNVTWSPNGKKLLFRDSSTEIYTIWPDGSHRAVISDGESFEASWSPDGNQIVFIENPSEPTLSISGPDGSISYLSIAMGGYSTISKPSWSPDGKQLLFKMSTGGAHAVSDLFTINLSPGAHSKKIVENATGETSWQPKK